MCSGEFRVFFGTRRNCEITTSPMRILWIGSPLDDAGRAELTSNSNLRLQIDFFPDALQALSAALTSQFDVAVISVPIEGWTAENVLESLLKAQPGLPVLVRDEMSDLDRAIRLTRLGAFHYLDGATSPSSLTALLDAARDLFGGKSHRSEPSDHPTEPWREFLIGSSPAMLQVMESIRLLAQRRCTVLIQGETGTGKELVARALHLASPRARLPMIALNCSALPEALLEAELFGHVRGAFTGAVSSRTGRFEQANHSTLFLDEIADLPFDVQTKLLRVLQEREFQKLGSCETIRVDVRIIAACNVDLGERARQGRFREDLFYRLNVVPIEIPALRQRVEDIPALVRHFIRKVVRDEGLPMKQPSRDTLERLMRYSWPGNVRQLENAIEMAMILSGAREVLLPSDFRLPQESSPAALRSNVTMMSPGISVPDHGLDFERTVGQIERNILEQALRRTNGNKKQAAEMLGLKRTTLTAKLKSLELMAAG